MKIFYILWVSLFILGCAPKSYKHNEARVIVLKTSKIKFADLGYIRHEKDEVRVELFSAGQLVQTIEIDTLVCVNEGCLTKSTFNENYLTKYYPNKLLQNVLLGKPIFWNASLKKTENGFIQELSSDEYNIVYKVEGTSISFRDKKNRFLIKISDVPTR